MRDIFAVIKNLVLMSSKVAIWSTFRNREVKMAPYGAEITLQKFNFDIWVVSFAFGSKVWLRLNDLGEGQTKKKVE